MIDLHCHSNVSDGSLSMEDLIRLAKANGVTHLAITDHDTTVGILDALKLGGEYGIEVIPGIEISAYDFRNNCRAHILGYFIEPMHPAMTELCEPLVALRHENSRQMVERIAKNGYVITWEQVCHYAGRTGVFKQHIMHALMDAGYCTELFGELYMRLFARGGNGREPGLAYVPMRYADVVSAILAVRQAGGVAVLAHPGDFGNFDMVPEWSEAGLEGIEVYHPSHGPAEEERALNLARTYNLLITGGSDFHGLYEAVQKAPGVRNIGNGNLTALKNRLMIKSAKTLGDSLYSVDTLRNEEP